MLSLAMSAVVLLALPVVILLAIFRHPDPNHEFMIELLHDNIREHERDL